MVAAAVVMVAAAVAVVAVAAVVGMEYSWTSSVRPNYSRRSWWTQDR